MRRLEAAGIEIAADCINQSNLLTNDKCRQHDEGTKREKERERRERGGRRERESVEQLGENQRQTMPKRFQAQIQIKRPEKRH